MAFILPVLSLMESWRKEIGLLWLKLETLNHQENIFIPIIIKAYYVGMCIHLNNKINVQ